MSAGNRDGSRNRTQRLPGCPGAAIQRFRLPDYFEPLFLELQRGLPVSAAADPRLRRVSGNGALA